MFLQEDVDALMNCVMKDIGFSQGKPVAAFTIYKCLLHWKSFEAERTSVFDRLINMIGSAIEVMYLFCQIVFDCSDYFSNKMCVCVYVVFLFHHIEPWQIQ